MNLFKKVACFTDIHFGLNQAVVPITTIVKNLSNGFVKPQKQKVLNLVSF